MRVVHFKLLRVGAGTDPVFRLEVQESTQVDLPASAWARIAQAVKDDVDAMASGAVLCTPGGSTLVKG